MTVWHFAVLLLILLPLFAWAYRASIPIATASPASTSDLSTRTFALSAFAVVLGFTAIFAITSASAFKGFVVAVLWTVIGSLLFALLVLGLRVFRRRVIYPKRKILELWLFALVLALVSELLSLQMQRMG